MATMKLRHDGNDLKLKIYDDGNYKQLLPTRARARRFGYGLIPRNFKRDPCGVRGFAPRYDDSQNYPKSEWPDRIAEQEANGSSLMNIRMTADNGRMMDSLDQNGQGYCWMYSVTGGVMIIRAVMHLPFKRLSGHAGACLVKGYRDEGGWCTQALDHIATVGQPDVEHWPEKSMSRSNDTPAMRANAAGNRIVEWDDLPEGGQAAARFARSASLLLMNRPVILDLNWWSHSVLGLRLVKVGASSFGILILNSWTNDWENNGMAVLELSKATYDSSVSPRAVSAAA